MNKNETADRIATLPACALVAAILFAATGASAQEGLAKPGEAGVETVVPAIGSDAKNKDAATAPSVTAPVAPVASLQVPTAVETQPGEQTDEEEFDAPPLQVGDATLNLFAWQRSGEIASRTARPIAGNVAGRSYERYLKSFDYPIPERLGSTVRSSGGGGNGTSSGGGR
jgi:hypothetical protein